MVAVSLGLAVMIVSVAIATGFQKQIREKVIGFGAHIQIANFDDNESFEYAPIEKDQINLNEIREIKGVKHVQLFGLKAGIIKTEDQIQGVVLKGISTDFDPSFFADKIETGRIFSLKKGDSLPNDSVLISKSLASLLKLKVGDPIRMHFILGNQARARKFVVSGIFETGFEDFDKRYVFGDLLQIRKLNGWNENQVSGAEIMIDRFDDLEKLTEEVHQVTGQNLQARSIRDMYPQIFDWLDMQDTTVAIIISLMVFVAGITMISTLLILVLEKTTLIGILKALGMTNGRIQSVFLYNAAFIIGRGLLWGNIFGIGLCYLQLKTGFFTLPQESYYMSEVPINLDFLYILILNAGTFLACLLMLLIPSLLISKVTPTKAIRFD